jgi:hypothetical protein
MKESYQREEYCSDQRKGSLRHFQPPKNVGSNSKPGLSFYVAGIGVNECNGIYHQVTKDNPSHCDTVLQAVDAMAIVNGNQRPQHIFQSNSDFRRYL